jgi:F-type H+-transporting ATPase subunit a
VSKRKIFGVPLPILIALLGVILALIILGLLAGPIGNSLFHIRFPSWLVVGQPEPQLPSEAVFHIFGLPITNTLLASWITVVFLVVFSIVVTRKMKLVPRRVQAIFEFILGWIYDFCKSVAGEENGRKFFPVVCTIFLYVAFNAWLSLIPGFGSIHITNAEGKTFEILRNANTDINTPLAIALISFVFVEFYGLKMLSISYLKKFLNFGQFFKSFGQLFKGKFNFMGLFSGVIDIFIGALEALSELIRNVSFTFRLFGNMTAGEILILVVAFLIPLGLNWLVYGLELLIGFVQALVFSGLTLAFATMAIASHNEEEAH